MKYNIVALVEFTIETTTDDPDDDDCDKIEEEMLKMENKLKKIGVSLGSVESEEPIE